MGLKLDFSEKKTPETDTGGKYSSSIHFSHSIDSSQAPSARELEIKIGTIKRLIRDLSVYKEELRTEEDRYLQWKEDGEDEYVLRKQKQVIDECWRMIPDAERRLSYSLEKLRQDQLEGKVTEEDISNVEAMIKDAGIIIDDVLKLMSSDNHPSQDENPILINELPSSDKIGSPESFEFGDFHENLSKIPEIPQGFWKPDIDYDDWSSIMSKIPEIVNAILGPEPLSHDFFSEQDSSLEEDQCNLSQNLQFFSKSSSILWEKYSEFQDSDHLSWETSYIHQMLFMSLEIPINLDKVAHNFIYISPVLSIKTTSDISNILSKDNSPTKNDSIFSDFDTQMVRIHCLKPDETLSNLSLFLLKSHLLELEIIQEKSEKCLAYWTSQKEAIESDKQICSKYFQELPKAMQGQILQTSFSPIYNLQKDFSFQTGDPLGPDGDGGTSIWGLLGGPRFFPAEIHPKLKHTERGTVSMVTAGGEGGSVSQGFSGSQFFITLGDNLDYLNGKYTVFGKVAEGFDTLEAINNVYCDSNMRPFKDIRIKHTIILDDPFPDPEGLIEPEKSPLPSKEQLSTVRIGNDEKFDEDMDEEEAERLRREREAKAQALTLEMIGDLPFAEVKPPDHVLFVCKLNSATRDEDLELIFSRFGKIISCEIIRDRRTGDSLQYAFIEFEKKEDCEQAYFKMQDVLIDDKRIKVDFSQSVSKLSNSWRMETNRKRKDAAQKSFAGSTYLEKGRGYREYKDDNYSMVFDDYDLKKMEKYRKRDSSDKNKYRKNHSSHKNSDKRNSSRTGFRFSSGSDANSSQIIGNTSNSSEHTTPATVSTNASSATGTAFTTIPSTPSAPMPFGAVSFTFGNSTTPAGQPPAHPLGQGNITLEIHPFDTKELCAGTTGGIFGASSESQLNVATTGTMSTPVAPSGTSGSGTSLFNLGGTIQQGGTPSSTTTPFVFGASTPQLDAKSASQDKPTTTFSFGGISEKNTQTQQEKPAVTTKPFSFGASSSTTPTFSFGTSTKTDTSSTSAEKPSESLGPSKTSSTFSFGNTSAQQNQQKNEVSAQKPEESKPTFTFNITPNTTIKSTAPSTATPDATPSENSKPSLPADTSSSNLSSTLFKPQTLGSSNADNSKKSDSSQTLSKTASDATKSLPTTSTQEQRTSNLKNKTIDDIINKWTSDLETYSRQFNQQAAEVSKWDRLLIESGDKISKLYADTIEAEQTQLKVDQTLTYIESQQNEMSAFLDQYESQVQELSDRQFGGPDGMQPADQEREKVYNLAEKLTEQLDGLGRNLKSMIEEINTASSMINKTNEDDPLSSIIKILNSHLSSLQWIQSTTTKLHYKIEEVKKAEHSIEKQLEEDNFYNGRNTRFS
ncbi:hypothetical protein PORY_000371 [Pneumocystis oryctolagi]|uniref:Uncharacterized protein n=1 Tax=Pneumocystis oryctolagi TaxID=42067 RepID=A0ACB7CGW9_9ASCO|nr:hypothetical protein PORY_000371 [Pneumocystis oryctolagi]